VIQGKKAPSIQKKKGPGPVEIQAQIMVPVGFKRGTEVTSRVMGRKVGRRRREESRGGRETTSWRFGRLCEERKLVRSSAIFRDPSY